MSVIERALTPVSITIDGVAVPLDDVLADITIHVGRTGFFDAASASTCQLTLLGVDRAFTRAFRLGALLVVNASDGSTTEARFTGRFTDATLVEDVLTAIAVGRLRTLSGYTVGAVAYPAEAWSDRVKRAFSEAGLYPANAIPNPGFEEDTTNWTPVNTTITRDTATVRSGAASGKIAAANTVGEYFASPGGDTGGGLRLGMVPGKTYELSAWIYPLKASGVPLSSYMVSIWDFAADWGASSANPTEWDTWQKITVRRTIRAGANTAMARIGLYASPATGTPLFYVDGAEFVEVAATPPVLVLQPGPFDPQLAARAVDATDLASYLGELIGMIESAVADLPDGRILVQAITSRNLSSFAALSPSEVGYAPEWYQRLPGGNVVTVKYATGQVTQTDAASVAIYGPIARDVDTTFVNATDASALALRLLARDAYAHWSVPAAPLLVGRRYDIGQALELTELPDAAPYDPWTPILEGWTDEITAGRDVLQWRMELALSDPMLSGLALPWNAVPTSYKWNTINASTKWNEALTLDTLIP